MRLAAIAPLASFVGMGIFWGAWAALIPEVKRVADAPDGPFGLALLAVGVGALPAMLLAGRLWAAGGRRLLVVSLVAFGLAALLPLFLSSLAALTVALLLIGAASGALDVAMNADVSELEARTGRRLMFAAHALFSFALFVASIATGVAREAGADRFLILPGVAGAFFVIAALAVAAGPRHGAAVDAPPAADRSIRRWILVLGALCAAAFLIEDAIQSWSALHLERTLGASPSIGGAGPGVFAAAMFAGRALGQAVGKRASDRTLVVAGGLGTAAGMVIAAVAPVPLVALLGFGLAGGAISLVAPSLLARAGRLGAPEARGASISTLTTIGYMGFVIGPGFVGAVAGVSSLPIALVAVAVIGIAVAASGATVLCDPARGYDREMSARAAPAE